MTPLTDQLDETPNDLVDTFATTCIGLSGFIVQLSELDLLFKILVGAATFIYLATKTVLAIKRYRRDRKGDDQS